MAEVITFQNFRPPARYDNHPWTFARIEESADGETGFTLIDSVTLTPADADPALPMLRSFTTEHGTALGYWYRIVFADATGDLAQPTTPIRNLAGSTVAPHSYVTLSELQRVLGKTTPTAPEVDAMNRVLQAAAEEIDWELSYDAANPAPDPPSPIMVDVNLDRAAELWRLNYSPGAGIIPVGTDQVPVIAARDGWYRHRLRLLPRKTSFGVG